MSNTFSLKLTDKELDYLISLIQKDMGTYKNPITINLTDKEKIKLIETLRNP